MNILENRRIYKTWHNILRRCYNPKVKSYTDYGGRGIAVCNEWRYNFEMFLEWTLKNGYKEELSIDRIDNNGNYCPENCRWTTKTIQQSNRGKFKNNTSGYIGIYWFPRDLKWYAKIGVNNKLVHLGSYISIKKAIKVRNDYIDKHNLPHIKNIYIG